MAENEQELLTYARKIQNYCKSMMCVDECVFYRHKEDDCGLGGFSPDYWSIPRKRHRYDDKAKAINAECARALKELHEEANDGREQNGRSRCVVRQEAERRV